MAADGAREGEAGRAYVGLFAEGRDGRAAAAAGGAARIGWYQGDAKRGYASEGGWTAQMRRMRGEWTLMRARCVATRGGTMRRYNMQIVRVYKQAMRSHLLGVGPARR